MNSFKTEDVIAACRLRGPQLRLPKDSGLDGARVMQAMAAVESSTGADCGPKHEPAYEAGGAVWARNTMAPLLKQYPPRGNPPQSPAAMSYGPWQMMFINFQRHVTPYMLLTDLDLCATEFARHFNSFVLAKLATGAANPTPETLLAEIGEIWNLGHIAPDTAYTDKLKAAYDAAQPTEARTA